MVFEPEFLPQQALSGLLEKGEAPYMGYGNMSVSSPIVKRIYDILGRTA